MQDIATTAWGQTPTSTYAAERRTTITTTITCASSDARRSYLEIHICETATKHRHGWPCCAFALRAHLHRTPFLGQRKINSRLRSKRVRPSCRMTPYV